METTLNDLYCLVLPIDIFVKAKGFIIIHNGLIYLGIRSITIKIWKLFGGIIGLSKITY